MKKLALIISIFLFLLIPNVTKALVDFESGLKCGEEIEEYGKVTKTCTMAFTVSGIDADYNRVTIDLTLNNIYVDHIDLEDGWSIVSQTGNSYILESKDPNFKIGTHNIGSITFYKINAQECSVEFDFIPSKITRSCEVKNGNYYDEFGNLTTEVEFKRQCETHKCDVLTDGDNKYYFDESGREVEEDDYNESCGEKHYCEAVPIDGGYDYYDMNGETTDKTTYELTCQKHYCEKYDDDHYFNSKGESVTELEYSKDCLTHKCKVLTDGTSYGKNGNIVDSVTYLKECGEVKCVAFKDGTYYDKEGNLTDELTYLKECQVNVCKVLSDGTYYDKNGNVTDKETYEKECPQSIPKCQILNDKYYNSKGEEVSKEDYDKDCGPITNPKTGFISIGILLVLIITSITSYILIKRKDKFNNLS